MLLKREAKGGCVHVDVEMLLKLSDHVPVDGLSWIKNQLTVSKLILKDTCVHGNFHRHLSSDIFTILNIKIITENGIGKTSPSFAVFWFGFLVFWAFFFDCLKRIDLALRWKFESDPTLPVQPQWFVSLEYLFFDWEWKFYLEEAQIFLHLWRKEAVNLNFSIFKFWLEKFVREAQENAFD